MNKDLVIECGYLNKVFKYEILPIGKVNFTKSLEGTQNLIKIFDSIDRYV